MIKCIINGKNVELKENISLSDYIIGIGLNIEAVVVEYNYNIPDKLIWNEISLNEGDHIEIVKFIGGG